MADIMLMGKSPNYLGSWDIDELPNREVVLTIAKIVDEEVIGNEGRTEHCAVAYWREKGFKKMILNLTNRKTLCKLYKTKDTDKLTGKAVIIGIERVKAFGDVYDALRFRDRIPPAKTANLPKCEACGKDITPRGSMTAEQLAAYTKKGYGKQLCSECATKAAQAKAEAAKTEGEKTE